jgi:LPS-assembly lipoprotein
MSWRKTAITRRGLGRLLVVLTAAGAAGGCFQPLYGARPAVNAESVGDKLSAIEIPPVVAPRGTGAARLAVALRNSLNYDFNGGAGANAPTHRLVVNIGASTMTVIVDITSGRPDAQVDVVNASFQLIEIATGKTVLNDSTFAHVGFDVPGSAQRFAAQRAQRDAEDRATEVVADAIRNRLASFFVAGT